MIDDCPAARAVLSCFVQVVSTELAVARGALCRTAQLKRAARVFIRRVSLLVSVITWHNMSLVQVLGWTDVERCDQPDTEDAERGAAAALHLHLRPGLGGPQLLPGSHAYLVIFSLFSLCPMRRMVYRGGSTEVTWSSACPSARPGRTRTSSGMR